MFTHLEVRGFKALRQVTVPLAPFTLMLGPNGCGKTSVMEALQLLDARAPEGPRESQIAVGSEQTDWEIRGFWQEGDRRFQLCKSPGGRCADAGIPARLLNLRVLRFHLEAAALSAPCHPESPIQLHTQGLGLAALLAHLEQHDPLGWETLQQNLREILPEYADVKLSAQDDGARCFTLETRRGGYAIAARELSHGTLMALALLALPHLPQRPDVLCLEEPDHGMHPRLLRDIRDFLYRLSYPRQDRVAIQIIATTHNPYFLDLFQEHPEEVVIASKDGLEARFTRLSDHPGVRHILEEAPLSDCWYSGLLGGVPLLP